MFEAIVFYTFAAILLGSALCVVTARNPVHAALFLVLSFFTASAIWLLLRAEFLALTLMVVYVGAVMVLFLFVVMMLDINIERLREGFWRHMPAALVVGGLMAFEMVSVLAYRVYGMPRPNEQPLVHSNTKALGRLLYTDYVYAFEIAAVILLVAIIAAIALTLRRRKDARGQDPAEQARVRPADRVRIVSMPSEKDVGMIPSLSHYLVLGALLFAIAIVGIFLNRKNVIVLLMAIELMLLAVNLNFIAFSHYLGDLAGQVFVFFILTVAAAESAIGLAILVLLFRNLNTINVEDLDSLKGYGPMLKTLGLIVVLAPLAGAILAGLFGKALGRAWSHRVTILGVLISFALSVFLFLEVLKGNTFNGAVYTWITMGDTKLEIGFLIDRLTVLMMLVVTFVSLMVHIYTIGYMAEDPGYQRFFSYISLFTFSMLMLVMSNNFLQLFFGWEAVGLVSYLLIGFWYTRPTAIYANLKAFLVNRVGDFGFLLGIALILAQFGSLDYAVVFNAVKENPGQITLICLLLFVGAMGKSAQFPLHVWLPDSMEGPTPISALIHAATMVTAGIFMVARMSPLFELSQTALSVVLAVGSITAFSMALVAITQFDIKRVVAYSTLSQLGYMTAALGASAYSAGIFHLMTHAFFKAVLFLGAGSVIMAMHHEQDMRRMGGLKKYMPVTYWTVLIGAFANAGLPPFAGFFSKDAILEAVHLSTTPGAHVMYWLLVGAVFIGGIYSFRLLFMTFHGEERMDAQTKSHLHESPWVVTLPLVLLAIPSVAAGWLIGPVLFGYFGDSILILPAHPAMAEMQKGFHGVLGFIGHGFTSLPLWLGIAGAVFAWYLYIVNNELPKKIAIFFGPLYALVEKKYGFDELNSWLFAQGARAIGGGLWKGGDQRVIDGVMVNGSARLVGWFSGVIRLAQSGFLYWYAFMMIFGVCAIYAAIKYKVFA